MFRTSSIPSLPVFFYHPPQGIIRMSRLPPVHVQQATSRPGGLTGHDLMSIFPPSQSTPSYSSSPFGREEREYLSSKRDEHARTRTRDPSSKDDSSASSSSDSSTPPTRKPVKPAPRRTPNYQTQVHLDQGSGDSQFHVLRMPLASMSNANTPDCHFSEFRATQLPPRPKRTTS